MQIIPTILESDFAAAEKKIIQVKGQFKRIQIDVIDNVFTSGKTFELELINRLENTDNILWETHLMVKEPINWIKKSIFINSSRIIGQVEMMSDREKFVTQVKDNGADAGLAFDINSEVGNIPEETDVVLLLGRKAGFGSWPIDEKIYKKIQQLVKLREENRLKFLIGVDGGINFDNIKKLEDTGAEIAYCGRAVFSDKVEDNLKK